jgi:hypothetical protein
MILPDDLILRSDSPSPYIQRPPSPSSLLYTHSNKSAQTIKLNTPPKGRRGSSPQVKSPPLSAHSSSSNLRTMTDVDSVAQKHVFRDDALASSPTLREQLSPPAMNNWEISQQRRTSSSSGSVQSEDLENMMKWPGFDSAGGFDDSGVDLEEQEEEHDQFPVDTNGEDDMDNDRWLDGQDDGDGDAYSSAALSRRAEIILANAKKRLNVMEGNLRGARHSLLVSPSSFNTTKMSSELANQLAVARERDRKLYSGLGSIPPRQRPYNSSPLSSSASPGHSRVFSETSVPAAYSNPTISYNYPDKRASSAMGVQGAPWSPVESRGNGRFPIRESKSHEVMRDPRGGAFADTEDRDHSSRSYSRESKSPPNTLETLPEDEPAENEPSGLNRSSSTTIDLRTQMSELKGRISSLKQRAKEDNLRRRSLQSLRTPSPFTAAEIWYAGAEAYKTSPVAADAGVGFKQESPTRRELYDEADSNSSAKKSTPANIRHEERNKVPTRSTKSAKSAKSEIGDGVESHYEDAEYSHGKATASAEDDMPYNSYGDVLEDEYNKEDSNDFVSVEDGELEASGDSVYEDAVYDMPVTERHEDRVDAFDYEHFFLHSAMGTYSSASRRSSSGSADSVETTRPVTAILAPEDTENSIKRISLHQRNPSVDSVSTMATFATAAEDQSDDEDEGEDILNSVDAFSQHILPNQYAIVHTNGTYAPSTSTSTSSRSNSPVKMRTNGPLPAGDVIGALRTSKIFSALLEPGAESRLALSEEEKQLMYGVAASFQQVCINLQRTEGDRFQREEWKRRLDNARRVLEGEEVESESF